MRAKTPYSRAQGYATSSCCPSMANAEMKIFEAEKLHQPMMAAVSIIPIMPLEREQRGRQEVSSIHRV